MGRVGGETSYLWDESLPDWYEVGSSRDGRDIPLPCMAYKTKWEGYQVLYSAGYPTTEEGCMVLLVAMCF